MRRELVMAWLAVVLSFCGFEAHAGLLSWSGNTLTTGLTWHRPTINTNPGAVLALSGGGQAYQAQQFTVSQTGLYALDVSATGPGSGIWSDASTQSVLSFLYGGSFDPTLPLLNQLEN